MWLEAGSFKKSLMNGSRNNCFFPPALFCYGLLFLWRGEREDRSSECVGFFLFSEGARERLEAEEWPALDPTVVTTGSGEWASLTHSCAAAKIHLCPRRAYGSTKDAAPFPKSGFCSKLFPAACPSSKYLGWYTFYLVYSVAPRNSFSTSLLSLDQGEICLSYQQRGCLDCLGLGLLPNWALTESSFSSEVGNRFTGATPSPL